MISRCTSSVPNEDVVVTRLLYSNTRCSLACCLGSLVHLKAIALVQWVLRVHGQHSQVNLKTTPSVEALLLATVPFWDIFYHRGSKKTRKQLLWLRFCKTVPLIKSTNNDQRIWSLVCELCSLAWRMFCLFSIFDIFKLQQAALKILWFFAQQQCFCTIACRVLKISKIGDNQMVRHAKLHNSLMQV